MKWGYKALLVVVHSALIVVGLDIAVNSGKALISTIKG